MSANRAEQPMSDNVNERPLDERPIGRPMSENVIEFCDLTCYFGRKCAVDQLSLSVPRGSVFGLLGRNGSGKTTALRALLGLLVPTRGTARLLGHDCRRLPPEVRGRVGYLTESHQVYGWMRVGENGRFAARFFPRWNERVFRGVLDYFKLDPRARASHLSRGERAGLALALTLAPEPEVLVLDDPTLGLDPVARRSVLEAMVYLSERSDRTVLFSSHILGDVERIADQIAILDHGRLRALTTTAGFRERVRRVVLRFAGAPPEPPALPGLLQSVRSERELSLTIANFNGRHEAALAALGAEQTETVPLDFEEAFVNYVDDRGHRAFFLSDVAPGGAA